MIKFFYPSKLQNKDQVIKKIETIIPIFYAYIVFLSLRSLTNINYALNLPILEPLWPVRWLVLFNQQPAIYFIQILFAATAILNLLFWRIWLIRILGFIGLLEYLALINSTGAIGHNHHALILISFILVLGLNWSREEEVVLSKPQVDRRIFTFWGCQAIFLLTYTMSGLGKLWGATYQITHHQTSLLNINALGLIIADRLLLTHSSPILGTFLINNPLISWPLFISSIYLEFFAIYVAFKPSLHKIWSLSLIFFHLCIYFSMTIFFYTNIFILIIFFLNSPFASPKLITKQSSFDLPLFGFFIKKLYIKTNGHN